jgi:hypothetical protein
MDRSTRIDRNRTGGPTETAPARLRKQRCETCAHYATDEKECRLGPPVLIPIDPQRNGSAWPPTRPEKFCGQYKVIPYDDLYENSP